MIVRSTYGGCRILSESGSGAYGTVFLAKDALDRTVAIKIFHATDNLTRNLDGLRKCISTFKENDGFVRIFHCGIEDNHLFYIMEAADNATPDNGYTPDTLAYRLRDGKSLPLEESLSICRSITDACQKLHSQGMVHRDLKPENVIFVNGRPKIGDLDFLSDYNRTMSLVGSLGFIPPEFLSLQSLPKSPATDLYAIGKIFYCCVTGLSPEAYPKLLNDLSVDVLYKICIPLSKLCSKTPSDRPATCEELLALLPDAHEPSRKATFRQRMVLLSTMRPWLRHAIDIFLLVVILAFVAFGVTTWRRRSIERKREEAHLKTKRQEIYNVLNALRMSDGYPESKELNDLKQKIDEAASIQDYKDIGKMDDALHQMQSYVLNKSNEMRFLDIDHSASFDEKLRKLDTAFAFIHSPLARTVLPPLSNVLQNLEQFLLFRARIVFNDMPFGRDFKVNNLAFQFVPSKNASSPRCFWIMQNDISNELFHEICKYKRLESKHGTEHVGNLCLNDILACSRAVKMQIDEMLRLPPGYIVRPPTVGELERFFEFTAWGGNAYQLKRDPIMRPTPPIAAISDEPPYTIKQYILPDWHGYQSLPSDQQNNDSYTLRLVIAPGDDSFYEKAYGSGVEIHSAEKDGRIYAGLSCSVAFATAATAKNLTAIVNAKLIEPANFYEWKEIHSLVNTETKYPAIIGFKFQDGAWRRFSDGAAVDWTDHLPKDTDGGSVCLIANKTACAAIKPTRLVSSIVLQWDSKSQWKHRGDALRGVSHAPSVQMS